MAIVKSDRLLTFPAQSALTRGRNYWGSDDDNFLLLSNLLFGNEKLFGFLVANLEKKVCRCIGQFVTGLVIVLDYEI